MSDVKRYLSWDDVEHLSVRLATIIQERHQVYDVILGIARGGTIPATLLAQVLDHGMVLTAHLRRYDAEVSESDRKPTIRSFPQREYLLDKNVLVVDEVHDRGDSLIRVKQEVEACDAKIVHTAVLHFKPERNRYGVFTPTYFVEQTTDWIVYPWEVFAEKVAAHQLS